MGNFQITELKYSGTTLASGTTSGVTIKDVHVFIDNNGNVTQIQKKSPHRLKYYIDPNTVQNQLIEPCVIGIGYSFDETLCSLGVGLGLGDNNYGYAKYQ